MLKHVKQIIFLMIPMLVIGCSSPTAEETMLEVESVTQENFNNVKPKPNQVTEIYSYFLPSEMTVANDLENNIVLEQGDNIIAVFYDSFITPNSEKLYEEEKKKDKKPVLIKKLSENPTGFVKVIKIDGGLYELTVGLGGVKASTITEINQLSDQANSLSKLVNSFEFMD
ncbi:hypothetical protein [Radiobacillus sp. PE A8.2]|uniref:hypothetical protein n=1 Tax=Radiobacillus sp. PE A8.2 TaxID=3380349 RepID=UPI003890E6CE